jgi:hypothetical protein
MAIDIDNLLDEAAANFAAVNYTKPGAGNGISPDKYPAILNYLNNPAAEGQAPPYGDGIEAILAAKFDDNGDIIAIGQDGPKMLAIKIGDKDKTIAIRLANYEELGATTPTTPAANIAAMAASPVPSQADLIGGMKAAGDDQIAGWLNMVKDVILTADDLETARDAVFELYPELQSSQFARQSENYLTIAGMAGYFEAQTND